MTEEKSEKPVQTKHFETGSVKLEVEFFPRCRVTMKVLPEKVLWEKSKKKAAREISKEVSIPGFRKGKAPESLIEKKYPSALKQETDKVVANEAFRAAQAEAKVPILNGNSQVNFQTGKENENELIFQFETEPTIPSVNPADFTLEQETVDAVTPEKVTEAVEGIRMFFAEWEQIENRGIEESDFVVLDIDDIDQEPPVKAFSDARFQVTEEKMADWMIHLVKGLKKGETVEGESRADAKSSEEVKKMFKKKKVLITVKGIEKAILPPVDDSLARKLGTSSVEALQKKMETILTEQSNKSVQDKQRESIANQLCEKVIFDIPATVLGKEANHRMSQLFNDPTFKKEWDETMTAEQKEEKKQEITKSSENAIKLFYICRNIIASNDIPLSENELSPKYDSLLDMMYADPGQLNYENQSKERKAMEFTKLMLTKAEDWLIEQVKKKNA